MKWFLLISIVLLGFACASGENQDQVAGRPKNDSTISDVRVPLVSDSIDLLYFKKPYTDKERYTRFFKAAKVVDTSFYRLLESTLQLEGMQQDSVRDCMSEGKIFIPGKGDAFQVLYFSRIPPACSYLYVIRNGRFVYYDMTPALKRGLDSLEKLAKDPEAATSF